MATEDKNGQSAKLSLSSTQNDELKNKVTQWLTGQGYPLEMYAAKCCREAGFNAHQSWYYFDEESRQHRETDVFASGKRITLGSREFELDMTLECKQSREKPWVAFVQSDDRMPMHPKAIMVQRYMPANTSSWWRALADKAQRFEEYPIKGTSPAAYSLARVTFGSGSNEDVAYSALMSATKAAAGIVYWYDQIGNGDPSLGYFLVIPVLVLDAPFFSCCLNDDNELLVEPISRCTLLWKNRINQKHSPTTIVEIVTRQSLPEFLDDMAKTNVAIAKLVSRTDLIEPVISRRPRQSPSIES